MRERPNKHFTPKNNWINDPNGLIYHGGYYHLYFQHNPLENKWGHMSWGHARSTDLINWEELPVAIAEQPMHMIFSGSAVFDKENNRMAAFYTAATESSQSQWICFSHDGGNTFGEHQKILDLGLKDFRDPKVFKFNDHWIMVVVKSTLQQITFFKSKDLFNWEFLSDYTVTGLDFLYECPDLFELDGKWVLLLSTNPGGAAGGTGMYYQIGDFDGKVFNPESAAEFLDYGPDYYAAVTFNDAPERISIGWMNNWLYANDLDREIWNGSMTAARKLRIESGKLIQSFIGEVQNYKIGATTFEFKYKNGSLVFNRVGDKLVIDRSQLWDGPIPQFELPVFERELQIQALFDAGSIELSVNGHMASVALLVGGEMPELSVIAH